MPCSNTIERTSCSLRIAAAEFPVIANMAPLISRAIP
jgi:hypothetical protein